MTLSSWCLDGYCNYCRDHREQLEEPCSCSCHSWRHGRPHDERTAWDHELFAPPRGRWKRFRRWVGKLLWDWGLR